MAEKITAPAVRSAKNARRLSMLTAYDYPTALAADAAGLDMLLVGDSLAMVVLGHEDTLSVTMDEMIHHTRAVARGARRALVVGDMPFGSYHQSAAQAVKNAVRFVSEGGARAVKLEGADHLGHVRAIVDAGIPVMGHVGLTPQSLARLGGFKVQGKTADQAGAILNQARSLEEAGCFAVVLEAVPAKVAARITEAVAVPTIGIGAGAQCDGQVLVAHDVLGLFDRFTPKFVKRYAELGSAMTEAFAAFRREVEEGVFPGDEHTFAIDPEELDKLA